MKGVYGNAMETPESFAKRISGLSPRVGIRDVGEVFRNSLPTVEKGLRVTCALHGSLKVEMEAVELIRKCYDKTVRRRQGIQYEKKRRPPSSLDAGLLRGIGVRTRNNGRSLYLGEVSPGCIHCSTGYGLTVSHSEICTRKCFYCYQDRTGCCKAGPVPFSTLRDQIVSAHKKGILTNFAYTGGEPLTEPELVCRCLRLVDRITQGRAETRLYTNGDLLTVGILRALRESDLKEIRFGFNCNDVPYEKIRLSRQYIPRVMLEMPVLPDAEVVTQEILTRLDGMGIYGVNLKEMNFAGVNAAEFVRRGYRLRRQPIMPLYFSGLLPLYAVSGSEETAMRLLEFSARKRLGISVHYCSIKNKRHTYAQSLRRHSEYVKQPYEDVAKNGLLKVAAVYCPEHVRAGNSLLERGISPDEMRAVRQRGLTITHPRNAKFLQKCGYETVFLYYTPGSHILMDIRFSGRKRNTAWMPSETRFLQGR